MDGTRFDILTRTLSAPLSRRITPRGFAAGVLLALGLALDETSVLARKKGKKGKKNKRKHRKKKQCSFGRPRCGNDCCLLEETCRGDRCVHHCQDGVLSGTESDTDCGRACVGIEGAGLCGLRRRCAEPGDCASGFCSGQQCVECLIDTDCQNPLDLRCLDNFCFQCAIDADCPGPLGGSFQFCRALDSCPRNQPCVCRECRNDADCDAEHPHCQPGTDGASNSGICFACLVDGHCPAERPHCTPIAGSVLSAGRCVECVVDAHCPEGQLCDAQGRCEGFECEDNQDCPTGIVCEEGACTGSCIPPGGIIGDDEDRECCSGVECISGPDDICCGFGQSCVGSGDGDHCE
jgi:Cys-rich repeat protein